tara:strand:- start:10545 stop:11012 length:468 start_codon:yes stop_codon:yes gene_type:complete
MELLSFLNAKEREILELIYKAQYKVEENTPLCLIGKEYFGFFKRSQKTVVICTENAKKEGGYFLTKIKGYESELDQTGIYIRRALRHEAVHIAQDCNHGNLVEISAKKKIKIHPYKMEALKGSSIISGREDKEYQAYALEDKPKYIISSLQRYCF